MFVVNPTFTLGQLVMTRRVNDLVADDEEFNKFVVKSLNRHTKGATLTMRTSRPMTIA